MTEHQEIVTLNGCFDLLHAGHIKLLGWAVKQAKNRNSPLVILLNSDNSIKKNKKDRPINSQQERMDQLMNFPGINEVLCFEEDTPVELLKRIRPKYHIFTENKLEGPEGQLVDQGIIKYALLAPKPLEINGEKYSSSRIIEKVLEKHEKS